MPLAYDIELDGAGYMVAPGTYRRVSDGMPEGRTGRVVVKDFFGGQRRALQLERDRGWDSEGVGPAYGGQGLEPWPYTSSHTDGVIGTVTTTTRAHAIVVSYAYVGIGRYLYQSIALTSSTWTSFAQVADVGAGKTITRLAYYQGNIAVCCGSGLDVQLYNTGSGTLTAFGGGGVKAGVAVGYANRLVYSDPTGGNEAIVRMSTGGSPDARELDGPIVNMALHGGKVVIATKASLWLLGGRADPTTAKWLGEPEPFFSQGAWTDDDDYVFLTSFGGRLYTWLAGQVMEWNPNTGSNKQGWRATGLEGAACYGATVAANMLIVCLVNRQGESEVWAFDGAGWWLVRSVASSARIWPMATGGAGNIDLVVFRDGSSSVTYDLYRLAYRDATYHSYNTAGSFRTSLLDAGERDKVKAWRKIGCAFAAPDVRGNAASADAVTVALAYSLDGGKTFTTAVSTAVSDPAGRTLDLEASLANAAAVSRFLMLRVSFSSVLDWAPVLTGVWAEYELLDAPAKRRKWSFKIHAREAAVQRDGRWRRARGSNWPPTSGPTGRRGIRSRSRTSITTRPRSPIRSGSSGSPRRSPNRATADSGASRRWR
jgi:hypothetical protein